jgi:hypothetical protein
MPYMRFFLLISLICILNQTFAQTTNLKNYTPLESNQNAKTNAVLTLNNKYKSILQSLPEQYRDKYKEVYKEMQKEKLTEIEKDAYLFNDEIQKFFDDILAEIKRGNPTLSVTDLKFFVSKDYAPNAQASLDGTIAFNLSLLANCENESQVAFILCHELAHNQLKHAHKSVKKSFDALYSKQAQKAMKEIAKSEYNSYEKAEAYLKTIVFSNHRHTRDYEEEADSMALRYLLNTRFDATQSPMALLMLDNIDSLMLKDNVVTGYYSFYQLDKKDKKTRNYQLNILDQNLTPLSNKKFSSQEDLVALEAAFNGELLMIKFFDDKSDKYILITLVKS